MTDGSRGLVFIMAGEEMALGKQTKSPHPNHTMETELQSVETEKRKWVGCKPLNPRANVVLPQQAAQPLEMVPPTGDQLLKCRHLWGAVFTRYDIQEIRLHFQKEVEVQKLLMYLPQLSPFWVLMIERE